MAAMDIEQLEALALSDDRAAALARLVPGSEDHDYWRAVELQHRGALADVDALLATWTNRHGDTARRQRLVLRQRLLQAGADLATHGAALADELGVTFHHQPDAALAATRYPSALDPAVLDEAALLRRALERGRGLAELTLEGVRALAPEGLDPARRRQYLERVDRLGAPGLVDAIAKDLGETSSRGFGSLAVHRLLTAAELAQLEHLQPKLAVDPAFVAATLTRRQPPEHVDWSDDLAARVAYLDELAAQVAGLPRAFAPLKALIAYHRLGCDLRLGRCDRRRLRAYLELPRAGAGASRAVNARYEKDGVIAVEQGLAAAVALPPIGDDSDLVRRYVEAVLAEDDGADLAEVLDAAWLTRVRAEVRLLAGADDPRWAGQLGADAVATLRERVELELLPDNPTRWDRDAEVTLTVAVKHVPTLRVRVFRINTAAWFAARGGDVDLAIDLDGMTAGWEEVRELAAPPMVRQVVRLALPACARPGTYVIELIGGGRASRALIKKGELRLASRPTAAGLAVDVLDERGQACPGASLWLGGRELRAGADGAIPVPFSTRPGPTPVLLVDGDVAAVATLELRGESYGLAVAWLLERQSLVAGEAATAVARVTLTLGGAPVSRALLEQAFLEITTVDRKAVTATHRQPLPLADDADAEVSFAVPVDARSVALAIGGRVRVVSEQRTQDLRVDRTFAIATMHDADATAAMYLRPGPEGLYLGLYGKSGEPRAGRAVALALTARAVTWPIEVTLATDARGELALGALPGVTALVATAGDLTQRFAFDELVPIAPREQVVREGDPVVLPAPTDRTGAAPRPRTWQVVELRGGAPHADVTRDATATPGALDLASLRAGRYLAQVGGLDYQLVVVPRAAPAVRGWAALPDGVVELTARPPTTAQVAIAADGGLQVRVRDGSAATRVHVVASPLAPSPVEDPRLAAAVREPRAQRGRLGRASYVSGRDIGDEYRYVLDRQRAARRPGVLLDKPSLLLNPWALRTTSTATQQARAGAPFPPPAPAPAMASAGYRSELARERGGGGGGASDDPAFASHDFLAAPARVLANLAPDATGVVRVDAATLGDAAQLHVVIVDPTATTAHRLVRAAPPLAVRDQRLAAPLPLDRHVREDRRLAAVPAATAIAVLDRATSRVELVDTVDKLYRALCALSGDATLASWDFLPRWASLPEAEKRALYSRHACHELALFIHGKDRAWFDRALKPYLVAKLHPTLIDHWLTDADLTPYLAPYRLARLNALELALLARRHPEVGPVLHRRLADAVELIAPDPGADDRLVDTIVAGGALGGDSFGEALAMAADEPAPEPAMQAFAVGGPEAKERAAPKAKKAASRRRSAEVADEADDLKADLMLRGEQAPMYRAADRTQEWAEHNWWQRRVEAVGPELIAAARLWRDLAAHRDGPFLSPHVVDAATSLPAAMAALAFLDLPFAAQPHAVATRGAGATITAGSHAIAAVVEVATVAGPPNQQVLIGQSYFRADDRYTWDGAEQVEKYVTGELVAGVVYACQIVVTNPTSRSQALAVLHQIPAGAIAVGGAIATATARCRLDPYESTTIEYRFYFPSPGRFDHYGAQVTRAADSAALLLAAVPPRALDVVAVPTTVDSTSWPHLAQHGDLDAVCAFLAGQNLGRVELAAIAWRCRDRAAFVRIVDTLAERRAYDDTLWSYALHHRDRARTAEWLAARGAELGDLGPAFTSPLFSWEPVERGTYQHLEYAPLINARAHRLGDRRTILNDGLAAQWQAFIDQLAHRPRPRAEDYLAAAHYLFAMDRPDEAIGWLARVDAAAPGAALQRDYLQAYAAVVGGELARARGYLAPHRDHPVDRWRTRFAALAELVAEAEGGAAPTAALDADSREQVIAAAARATPSLAVRVDGEQVVIDHAGVARAEVRLYRVDLELLFSRQPFFGADSSRFGFIEAGRVEALPLPATGPTRWPLPDELRRHSLVVEVVGDGARASATHFAHQLAIAVTAPYGRVQVRHAGTGAPRVAAYVKCYARSRGGGVQFYKDGYTDVCGRFDYATLSTDDLDRVERFALLVVDDQAGAAVVEAAPPPR
jgi:hypothetical protein